MDNLEKKTPVVERAYAKINLILAVTAKRTDGYHELQTVFQSLALHDTLTFTANAGEEIALATNNPSLSAGPDNLIWRAAERLKQFYKVRAGVSWKKNSAGCKLRWGQQRCRSSFTWSGSFLAASP